LVYGEAHQRRMATVVDLDGSGEDEFIPGAPETILLGFRVERGEDGKLCLWAKRRYL
jgi:hypothetical protein